MKHFSQNISDKRITTMSPRVRGSSPVLNEPEVTLSHRSAALVRGLTLVLEHHKVCKAIQHDLYEQIHANLDSAPSETVWLKRAKYLLSYPLARYLRNELPPSPDQPFRPTGRVRKWMRQYLTVFNRTNTHLWYSWFQAKRSSLPASEDIIEATYEKHLETLTREDPGDEDIIDQIMDLPIFQRLLGSISNQVARSIRSKDFVNETPSGSATFASRRSDGGQCGNLRFISGLDRIKRSEHTNHVLAPAFEKIVELNDTELVSMNWYPTVYLSSSRSRRSNFLLEQRCVYGRDLWSSLRLHTRDINVSTPNRCVIQGILEPFKVRVISKGEALPYYSCKPLQKALHGALRDLDPFRLIGRPLSPTDFIDLKKKSTREDNWFSVDYSAATDGLSWLYSGQIFQRVISKLPFEEQLMAMKVLGPHDLYYPIRPEGEKDFDVSHPVFKGTQTNGQLMGSVLSFPILCLANLGVYLLVTESVQKGWTDRERLAHVLVNGDDMVYAAHPDLWSRHVEVASKVGLEMSVGKAYVHPVYANVNSTSVHYDLRKEGGTPWQIDYLNAGLFYGQHKVQEAGSHRISLLLGDEERAPNSRWENTGIREKALRRMLKESDVDISKEGTSLTSTINWILQGSLPGRQKNLLSQFLTLHKEELRQEQAALVKKNGKDYVFSRNLFLPESLGGMGVVPPAGFNFQLKPIQKKVALSMIRKNVIPSTSQLPLPGFPVEKLDLMVNVPWSRTVAVREVFTTTSLDSLPSKMLRAFGNLLYGSCRSTFRI